MSEETVTRIGKKLEGIAERDAIHIAVYPVTVATERLSPGQSVIIQDGKAYPCAKERRMAIIDPFINGFVLQGERCFVFMLPGSITGLRHDWTHPDIETAHIDEDHETWLRDFAERYAFDYDDLIYQAQVISGSSWDHYITAHGRDLHGSNYLGEDHELFWHHLEGLTGKRFESEHRENFGWSCSC